MPEIFIDKVRNAWTNCMQFVYRMQNVYKICHLFKWQKCHQRHFKTCETRANTLDVEAYHIVPCGKRVDRGKKEVVGVTCSNSRHGTDGQSEPAPRLRTLLSYHATVLGWMDGWKGGRME